MDITLFQFEFMTDFAIHLSATSQPEQSAVGMLDLDHAATVELFDRFEPSFGGNRIQLNYLDGITNQESASGSGRVGEFLCIASTCVSDATAFESMVSIASVDPGLLAHPQPAALMNSMNIESGLQTLNSELIGSVPKLLQAINGELGHDELSQLILDIQLQVLELNSVNRDLFGDLSAEVNTAVAQLETIEPLLLLDSMQMDIGTLSDSEFSSLGNSLALEATLDGLFTSPEAFPLTLDFSNPNSVQEASVLFAAASSSGSSISSAASGAEAESIFPGSPSGAADFS